MYSIEETWCGKQRNKNPKTKTCHFSHSAVSELKPAGQFELIQASSTTAVGTQSYHIDGRLGSGIQNTITSKPGRFILPS